MTIGNGMVELKVKDSILFIFNLAVDTFLLANHYSVLQQCQHMWHLFIRFNTVEKCSFNFSNFL